MAATDLGPGSATFTVKGTCHHDCPDSCGWEATVEHRAEGPVAVRLRGNSDHPYSRGELCPKVNRFLDRVYHPDRLLHPLVRTGAKGSGSFREVSWPEALAIVATRLRAVVDEHGGEAVVPWSSAGTQGLVQMSSLDRRFFSALGASRLTGSLCGNTAREGVAATYGSGRTADPTDVRFSRLVLLWGTNTKLTNRHLWPFVEEARASGATVVVVDPLRTATAEAADWFLQPLPGTDVALILGMLHVLIRDDLVDRDYLAEHAVGFDELAAHVRPWTTERAAAASGLEAADVERLAQMYGTVTPTFIRTLIGAEHQEHGAMFFRALACLPVVTGAWRHKGGGLSRSVGVWFDANVDDSVYDPPARPGTAPTRAVQMNHLGRLLTDPDAGVHALFVWNGNPAVTLPGAGKVREGLAREDLFTVVSEQFLTDTARFADVIFPATTQLEQLDVVPAWGHLNLGWNTPAIPPRGESVPNTELWRRLAAAMDIEDPLFALDDEALLGLALHDVDLDALQTRGWVRISVPDDLRVYADGGFATPSGKAELLSERLAARGHPGLPEHLGSSETGDGLVAPLHLLSPKAHPRFLNSSYSAHHGPLEDGPYLEMSSHDASERGLGTGDLAEVRNDRGSLVLPVRVSGRVRPGVVAVPWGWWGDEHAVNALTNDTITDWGGGVAFFDTQVEVVPALRPDPTLSREPAVSTRTA